MVITKETIFTDTDFSNLLKVVRYALSQTKNKCTHIAFAQWNQNIYKQNKMSIHGTNEVSEWFDALITFSIQIMLEYSFALCDITIWLLCTSNT